MLRGAGIPPSSLLNQRPRTHSFEFTSHNLIVLSWLPEASVLPSGLNATELMARVCPFKVVLSLPALASQSLIVLSRDAEASILPSGLNATHDTHSVCPSRVARSLPVLTFHSLTF